MLRLVSRKPDGITLDEICEKLDLPGQSGYDIVTTLVRAGMIHKTVARGPRGNSGAAKLGLRLTGSALV